MDEYRSKIEQIVKNKETSLAKELTEDINDLIGAIITSSLPDGLRERWYIEDKDERFNEISWINPNKSRQLVNQGLQKIQNQGDLTKAYYPKTFQLMRSILLFFLLNKVAMLKHTE